MYNTIYPNYVRPYTGLNNGQIKKRTDDEKKSQSSQQAENNTQQIENNTQQASKGRSLINNNNSFYPNGEKVAIDYTKQQIGIEQVLKDFRNTTNAIGAPANIKEEVEQYLKIIENQAQKIAPNPQAIQSNLKYASQILDEYITNTLKKPSKVVENWVDALFLQQINYKAEQPIVQEIPEEIPQIETAQETTTAPIIEEVVQEEIVPPTNENGVYVPTDAMLKRLFVQAKKYGAINEKEKALYAFQTAMDYAKEIGDEQTCAMIHYEEGRIYDDFNDLNDALSNYDKAIKQTKDNNLKARASLYMGKIYDDYVKFEPAVNHYCAAVTYAGEADNLPLQSKVLSDLAQLHSERYDKDNTILFMNMSDTIADETGNDKVIGFISYRNADCCERLNEPAKALKYYGKSAKALSNTSEKETLAKDYQSAAEIMLRYGNKAKAKSLLSKAFIAVQGCDNAKLKQQITDSLYELS